MLKIRVWQTRRLTLALVAASVCATACQNLIAIDVVRSPVTPVESKRNPDVVLQQTQTVTLDTGYERTLAQGSHWKLFGTIVEGQVYQPTDGDFTIQGREPVSAYLVVNGGQLVGFYVPIEEGFSPLYKKISIAFGPAAKN